MPCDQVTNHRPTPRARWPSSAGPRLPSSCSSQWAGGGQRGKEKGKEGKDEEDEREIVGEVIGKQQVESSMTKGGVGRGSQSETDKLL